MHADQGILGGGIASHESYMALSIQNRLVADGPEVSVIGGHADIRDLFDELLALHAVADQALDGHHLQAVLLCKPLQLRQPGHGSVLGHDLADHAGRVEAC
ncbi:Uncharacterised protein [uncultured archaeon]|nr:Uncharacterised protein [uncultured archaeon]